MNIHFHLPAEVLTEPVEGAPAAAGPSSESASLSGSGGFVENPPVEEEGGGAPAIENQPVEGGEEGAGFTAAGLILNPPVDAAADLASFGAAPVENPPPDAEPGAPGGVDNPPVED